MNTIKEIIGGVTAVPGFLASGVYAGLKSEQDKLDLALLFHPKLCAAAGVFTTNVVKAAPVILSQQRVQQGYAHGVVINSGNANACNGPQGMKDALAMAATVAQAMGVKEEHILVSSTGVIGQNLPMDKLLPGIKTAAQKLSTMGGQQAAMAIMTTDTVPKEKAVHVEIGGKTVTIGGMAKGSGMIQPNMATMLAVINTDAVIKPAVLQSALKEAVDDTFNMITVDGDTSTNDSVMILASGTAQHAVIEKDADSYQLFVSALKEVCGALAQAIARDGEGATKLLTVTVKNASTQQCARKAALAVAGSNLFKAAAFGQDANWGRILCAVGYSGAQFNPEQVDIFIGDEQVAQNGGGLAFDEKRAAEILAGDSVTVTVDLKEGAYSATAWGCDLTYEYVRINGSYRT